MIKYSTLALLVTLSFLSATAQHSRQIVVFKDKKGTQSTLANPSAYLSAKAIARRTSQGIAVDSTDLPISRDYLDSIAAVPGVIILNKSKWLNQVLVRITDPNAITRINSFPFVKSTSGIAPRVRPGYISKNIIEEAELPVDNARPYGTAGVDLDYGGTVNQIRIHKGEYLHNLGFTGQTITMAILDAGFLNYKTNPALDSVRLQGRILGEWDYVANHASVNEDNNHGANCFSIIASNRPGIIVGSAPHARFWLLRTEDVFSEYPIEEQNWAVGAEFADSAGVDMISSSLGYSDFDDPAFDYSHAERDGNTSIVTRAADLAARKGIIVMNSAGNSGASASDLRYVNCPADGDSVCTVGAVDVNGNIANFSSWGPNGAGKLKPNIVSVGAGTVYASTAGNPVAGNGTSYSNPNVAGLIACFWQAFPELNNMQVIDAVQKSSHRYLTPDARYGYGIPDFRKAFITVLQQRASVVANLQANNCAASISWQSKDNNTMQYRLQRRLSTDTGFITIHTVTGSGVDFQTRNYLYVDNLKDILGNVQYRVQQVVTADTTVVLGTSAVTVVDVCTSSMTPVITVSPNPVRGNILRISISSGISLPQTEIVVVNMRGQIVKRIRKALPQGISVQEVGLANLAAGMYVVKIYSGSEEIFTTKIIK
ncbi:MAG TPA: S8 family peptidase [Chitinophagaceae bacterium]|nr:S8 family peptidase [Chitinophagaceae bacterium]